MLAHLSFCGVEQPVAVRVSDIELPVPLLLLLRGEGAAVQRAARAVGTEDARTIHVARFEFGPPLRQGGGGREGH